MREFRTSGSVRGALSNERPYREQRLFSVYEPDGRCGQAMTPINIEALDEEELLDLHGRLRRSNASGRRRLWRYGISQARRVMFDAPGLGVVSATVVPIRKPSPCAPRPVGSGALHPTNCW